MYFFEEAKMNYITTTKIAFLAQGVLRKKRHIQKYSEQYLQGQSQAPKNTQKERKSH